MMTISQTLDLALQHQRVGQLVKAEVLYRQILEVQPNHADALHFLGVLAHQVGRHDRAVELIRQAILLEPGNFAAYSNLGEAWRGLGRWADAIAAYRRALELEPKHSEAHNNLGLALVEEGRYGEAVTAYGRALQLRPDFAEAHNNLGIALAEQGRFDDAIAAYRRALELKSDYPETHNNLGNAFKVRGRLAEAIAAYRCAIEINPEYPDAYSNLAAALSEAGNCDEAIIACGRAIELRPQLAAAYNNLGNALRYRSRLDEATAAYRRALEIKANSWKVESNLGNALRDQADFDGAIAAYRRAIHLKPDDAGIQSNFIYTLEFHPGLKTATIEYEKRQWNRQFSEPSRRLIPRHANWPDPERRLRVGYVSSDFCDHVVGRNLRPLFVHCDQKKFDVLCYSAVVRSDNMTDEFRQCANLWRSVIGMTDEALAAVIREDAVDILVDVTQHMAGNRLTMFGHEPTPVQVSFVGYPESTGVEAIKHRISDRYLEKEDEKAESIEHVHLLDSFWCYDPCGMEIGANELPAKANGRITFGSLNNFCKINDSVLKLWARVVKEVKESHLTLLSGLGNHRPRILELLAREGVDRRRVEFVQPQARREYLELYHRVDVALDPFPYGGHSTNLDALWMGVPVVSLVGDSAVSRAGLSQLSNLGLNELAAYTQDDYVKITTQLAYDLPQLTKLRATLRARMEASLLMDGPRFARAVENAYRAMWRRWCTQKTGEA